MDWFTQAIQDVGNAIEDGVEAVGEVIEDGVEAVVDFIGDAAEVVVNTVEAVVDSTVGFVETVVDVATGESDVSAFGDWAMNTMDDLVFDQVDFITGGAVDVDYDDGQFTAGLDFGIGSAGVSLGDNGFSADAAFDIGVAQGDMSYNSAQGFAATGSLGLDWGGLPTLEGHVSISPEGDVFIGGELQASLPGLSLDVGGDFYQNSDGSWGASGSLGVDVDLGVVQGGVHAAGSVDAAIDGFAVAGDLDASFAGPLGSHGEVELGGAAAATLGPDGVSAEASAWGNVDVNGAQAGFNADGSAALAPDGDFAVAGNLDANYSDPFGTHGEVSSGFEVGREDGQIGVAAYGEASGGVLGVEGVIGRSVAASAGGGHLEVDVNTWSDSSFANALDPSVLLTDSGLGRPPSLEDAFGAAAGGLGMSGGAAAGRSADSVTGTEGVAGAPGQGSGSGGAAVGRFADPSADSVTGTEGVAGVPGQVSGSGGAAAGQAGADPGTPEQWPDLGVGSSVETGAESAEPMVEIPDPTPPDDFSADLAAADQAGEAADDIWEGMGTSEG